MIGFLQEVIALLPLLIISLTILLILLCILIFRDHFITFCITVFGISLSILSLYLVCNNGVCRVSDLMFIDGFSVLCMILILISSLVIVIISRIWLSRYYIGYCDEFYLLLLIMIIGSIVIINASHVATLFFGIELISLPLFGLMGYVNIQKYSLEATIKYVLLSGVSTAFLLFGLALIYIETEHLSFMDISFALIKRQDILSQSMVLMFGVAMILVGFCFKLSLVPCHLWTPDVYQGISEISGMCLATINKIAIFSVFVRFFILFPNSYIQVHRILILISCFSILFSVLMAIKQNNIKRILAYSSISQMGYLLIGLIGSIVDRSFNCDEDFYFISLSSFGGEVISVYLVNYVIATLGVFSIMSLVYCFYCNDKEYVGALSLYRGLFWKDPVLSIIFTIFMLSLSGIPITLGFISKFYLIMLSIQKELWWCLVFVIFGTLMGIVYYLRIVTVLYLGLSFENRFLIQSFNKMRCDTKLIMFPMQKNYYTKCIRTCSGIFTLFFSILLLFFGIYPQWLFCLFNIIQKQF